MESKIIKTIKYPCLKVLKKYNMVVLFTNDTTGTIVSVGDAQVHEFGYNCSKWGDQFKLYNDEIILENRPGIIEYPLLKIAKDLIMVVLLTDEFRGTVVFTNNINYELGYYADVWFKEYFKLFNDKIVLKN